mmetsp:Transcript_67603/g.209140  ORF Transcript_67603/g.209140 Transcript_67603/m.209140 type:complete len:154 (-) Transcript_67603:180-641(-)
MAAEPFPRVPQIVSHMNEDHGDSILAYALHYAGFDGTAKARATGASLTDLDYDGLTLSVTTADGGVHESVRVAYPGGRLEDPKSIRKVAVDMHHEAHSKLGLLYRLQSGYTYRVYIRDGLLKNPRRVVATVGLVGAFVGLLSARRRWVALKER